MWTTNTPRASVKYILDYIRAHHCENNKSWNVWLCSLWNSLLSYLAGILHDFLYLIILKLEHDVTALWSSEASESSWKWMKLQLHCSVASVTKNCKTRIRWHTCCIIHSDCFSGSHIYIYIYIGQYGGNNGRPYSLQHSNVLAYHKLSTHP